MKNIIHFLFILFMLIAVKTTASASIPDSAKSVELCKDIIQQMNAEKFQEVYNKFDEKMKSAISLEKISEIWRQVLTQTGGFKSFGDVNFIQSNGFSRVQIDLEFKVGVLQAFLAFDENNMITGFFIKPKVTEVYKTPLYVDTTKIREIPVSFGKAPFILSGMLTVPAKGKNFPVIIMVSGSGPNDMDETVGPNKPFLDIAEGLAMNGVAALRFNKRTFQYRELSLQMEDSIDLTFEYTTDVEAAFNLVNNELSKKYNLNPKKIFILGHSLGGTMIPRFAQKLPKADGFIIMAGMTVPFEEELLNQYEYIFKLDGKLDETEQANLDDLKHKVRNMLSPDLSTKTPKDSLPMNLPAFYWLDFRSYKPAESAKKITRPVFALQGGRDYQVSITDFNGWKSGLAANKKAVFKLYDDANHIFISGSSKSTPEEYMKSGNVMKSVVDDIADWVLKLP